MKIYAHFGILLAALLFFVACPYSSEASALSTNVRGASEDDIPEEVPKEVPQEFNPRSRRSAVDEEDVPEQVPREVPEKKKRSTTSTVDEDDVPKEDDIPQEFIPERRFGRNRRAAIGKDDIPREFPKEIPEELPKELHGFLPAIAY